MKLSKTAWWILGIGFFVLAAIILVVLQSNQSGDAERMEENLMVTQGLLNKLTSDSEELNSQLGQLQNQLDEAESAYLQSKTNFPKSVMSIEYDEELFFIAEDYDLEMLSLTTTEPTQTLIEDVPFANTIFEAEVRGQVANILLFIDNVATGGYFTSAAVELVNMEVPEPDLDEEPTAIIKITVYSYEGD